MADFYEPLLALSSGCNWLTALLDASGTLLFKSGVGARPSNRTDLLTRILITTMVRGNIHRHVLRRPKINMHVYMYRPWPALGVSIRCTCMPAILCGPKERQ